MLFPVTDVPGETVEAHTRRPMDPFMFSVVNPDRAYFKRWNVVTVDGIKHQVAPFRQVRQRRGEPATPQFPFKEIPHAVERAALSASKDDQIIGMCSDAKTFVPQ